MSATAASATVAREASRTLDRLLERPYAVLGALAGAQLVATVSLALTVTHNGWVYFQGGDQIWLATQGWLLGQLQLPPTELGFFWSLVLEPIMWITGPTFVQALPVLVVLQLVVLAPVALLCVYGIAAQIAGRLAGYWAAVLWVVAPYAAIPLFVERYREKWTEHFLPQALGLTAMADFPSMVLVLASAYFVVRSLGGHLVDAAMAGLLLGAAGATKPPNFLLGVGVAMAYLVARRWREGVAFAGAVLPALLVLSLWKVLGLGRIPAFSLEEAQVAAGAGVAAIDLSLDRYLDVDLDHWRTQMDQLREFFWSPRLAQWAPFAGVLAVLRARRGAIAALLAGWLGAFLVVKGFSTRADIQANTFWRLLMPAWPAYLILFASIPLLVPTLARRLGDRLRPPATEPVRLRWLALTAVLTVAIPTAAIAAATPVDGQDDAVFQQDGENTILTPIDRGIEVEAERLPSGQVSLRWSTGGPWRASVFYRVYRSDDPADEDEYDVFCQHRDRSRAEYCTLRSSPIQTTRDTEFVDRDAPPRAVYRIGVATNWSDDPEQGDVFAFSPPVRARGSD